MAPSEKQSVRECAKQREECQKNIFDKMELLHNKVMKKLGQIDNKMAFQEGQEKTRNASSMQPFFKRALVNWMPAMVFLMILGAMKWGEAKGWW